MFTYNGLNPSTNNWNVSAIDDYREQISYDANGNIVTYKRNGSGSSLNLNNYGYTYIAGTNKLESIANSVNGQTKTYAYDEVGNTTADGMQGVTNAGWNVYGKLQSLTNKDGQNVTYTYDATGQRISKKVGNVEEWYVKDASGSTMAIYTKDAAINGGHLSTSEFYKYGSSLLGTKKTVLDMQVLPANGTIITFKAGETEYLLTDQRGNNMAAISDKKLQHSTDGSIVDYYITDVRTASLYSSYGAIAQSYNAGDIKLAFNGQRRSTEISATAQTAQFWEYNSDVGRRWNLDPVIKEYESPYAAFSNNPIGRIDVNGDTDTANAAKADIYLSVMNEAEQKMNTLAKQIKNYEAHIDAMKTLMNQQVKLDVEQSLNPFSFIPQWGSEVLSGQSSIDYMAATIAARVGEMANLVSKYNDAYMEYSYAAKSLKLEFKNATHFDIGNGVVLDRLGGAKMGAMIGALHKNNSAAEGSFALYEITIEGTTFKYGIADAGRLRKGGEFAGLPERLAQQLSRINKYAPELDVVGKVKQFYKRKKQR